MGTIKKISDFDGKYNSLSFPILGIQKIQNKNTYFVNDAFKKIFLKGQKEDIHLIILNTHTSKLKSHNQIHHKGNIYQVDEFDFSKEVKYYFYSLNSISIHHSFLWLKHDLLNILNPIMGFADVLEESEDIAKDDIVLLRKIKKNSNKIYQQIQKISLLQNPEIHNNLNSGSYEISDYINELKNQLLVNDIFENISNTEISHHGKVNNRIIQSDFRSTVEDHLSYLSNYQEQKDIKIHSAFHNHFFRVKIIISNCNPPLSYIEMIEEVDKFLTECKPIYKLQISALNYLILNEICDSFGASIFQRQEENDIILELNLPSLSHEDDVKTIRTGNKDLHKTIPKDELFKGMPDELFKNVKALFIKFDGLLILDEWQKMCDQLQILNKEYNDKALENMILEMQEGIQSFDVEKLRNIHSQCHQEFFR